MKYIDLFAGIGGFHFGLDQVGGFDCVYSNEWDKYANSVYRRHYGECDNRDIRKVEAREIPDFDLLTGGFPCQAFSVAGKRGGFADTRGTLFFEIARIAKEKRPRLLLLENVKGLLNHEQGRTFATILSALDEIGYDAQWEVLNSKNFGVPQNRERVYIVANTRGTSRPQVFPLGAGGEADDGERVLAHTLNASDWRGANRNQQQTTIQQLNHPTHSNDRIYGEDGLSPTLNTMQGGRRQPKVMRQPLRFLQRNQRNIEGDYAFTVDASQTSGVKIDTKIRRLTPIECERLQGFPDNWTKYGASGEEISDTQRYKMCGNALTTNIVTEIGKRI